MGDFNTDGIPDIVVANNAGSSVSVLLGQGSGLFPSQARYYTAASYPVSLALGDLNADGLLDIVTANSSASNGISVLLALGNTYAAPVTYATPGASSYVAIGNFSTDTNPDILVSSFNVSYYSSSVLLGAGNGTFGAASSSSSGYIRPAVGDVNADGMLDLVMTDSRSNLSPRLAAGNGSFNSVISTQYVSAAAFALGDLDGNGKVDLVSANNSSTITTLAGQGDATFANPIDYSVGVNATAITLARINGDDAPDVVVLSPSSVVVLLNNGNGTFASPVTTAGVTWSSYALGDLNSDGKADLVLASVTTGHMNVLFGDGSGNFTSVGLYSTFGGTQSIALADVDKDGLLEIISANSNYVAVLKQKRCSP